jgi:hypothetical protein
MPSSSDPGVTSPSGQGTLEVAGPHFTADLVVLNHQFLPVLHGVGTIAPSELPPGLYDIQATIGGTTSSHMVKVESSQPTVVQRADWGTIEFAAAAPLQGTSTSREWHTDPAKEWSQKITWTPSNRDRVSSPCHLFVFVRTLEPERFPRFAEGLELLDCDGRLLTELKGEAVRSDPERGWMAFTTELPPGPYLLRRKGRAGVRVRCQPIILCHGWETQIFVPSGKRPSLRRLSLIYAPHGHGYVPDDPDDLVAESVLQGLCRQRNVATSNEMRQMLEGQIQKPWMGVIAAHALYLDSIASENAAPSPLYRTVVEHVTSLLGDHPDVRALGIPLLGDGASSASPSFPFPPLLQASLTLIRRANGRHRGVIPDNSLTDCLLDHLYANSVWTGWGTLSRVPLPLANFAVRSAAEPEIIGMGSGTGRPGVSSFDPAADPFPEVLKGSGRRRLARTTKVTKTQSQTNAPTLGGVLADMALIRACLRPVASAAERTADAPAIPDQFLLQQLALAARQSQTYDEGKQHWNTIDRLTTSVTKAAPAVAGVLARIVNQHATPAAPPVDESEGRQERSAQDVPQDPQQVTSMLESSAATVRGLLNQTLTAVRRSNPAVPGILANLLSGVARALPTMGDSGDLSRELDDVLERLESLLRSQRGRFAGEAWFHTATDRLQQALTALAERGVMIVIATPQGRVLFANPAYALVPLPWARDTVPLEWQRIPPGVPQVMPVNPDTGRHYRVTRVDVEEETTPDSQVALYRAEPQDAAPLAAATVEELQRLLAVIATSLGVLQYTAARQESAETYRQQVLDAVERFAALSAADESGNPR